MAPASLVYANRVIDGDTIEVNGIYRVRYIGIDTPETVHPTKPVQFWGPEASQRNKELSERKLIFLVRDGRDKDDYDRLLRYIYLANGVNINAQLVVEGYAYYANYGDGFRFQSDFLQLELEARDARRGLWQNTPKR
ncbi:MAG: thermonuclease, TNase, micrococcal nuclease [Dehalococcoidia bacterium]|nr:thermonuclease, TNase, micrococcal nuclease [Dehalococcoidia bacterium]